MKTNQKPSDVTKIVVGQKFIIFNDRKAGVSEVTLLSPFKNNRKIEKLTGMKSFEAYIKHSDNTLGLVGTSNGLFEGSVEYLGCWQEDLSQKEMDKLSAKYGCKTQEV